MENSFRLSSKASGPQSLAGDSRTSEISVSSISANLRRLFDFSQEKMPGLYRVTSKYFILEFCESDSIAYSKFHTSHCEVSAKFIEEAYESAGIMYVGFILVEHPINTVRIPVPAYRSYDPAGSTNNEYLASRHFLLIIKFLSILVRASTCGVREKRLSKIQQIIQSVSPLVQSMSMLWQYTFLSVKLSCYKHLEPPKYFEFILNKVLTHDFDLNSRDDCKEYLEKCLKGGDVRLPVAYYKSVLKHEKKLPFDVKVLYSECQNRENKEDKAQSHILKELPKLISGLTVVKEGKGMLKLMNDCERLHKLYEANVHQSKCKVM